MYHRVSPDVPAADDPHHDAFATINVTPEAFGSQMNWLAQRGYQSLTLDDLIDAREHRRTLPRRSVVLTFDDGYQDFIEHAAPVLRRHGFTAHIFLVAADVGGIARWVHREFGWEIPLFDWNAARALETEGFHCDAHGLTHRKLGALPPDENRREILESQRMIADELGREIRHFSYPHGSYNEESQSTLREAGFRSACAVWEGLSPEDDDRYALNRVWVNVDDSLFDFQWSVRTGVPLKHWPLAAYRRIRDRIRSVRRDS